MEFNFQASFLKDNSQLRETLIRAAKVGIYPPATNFPDLEFSADRDPLSEKCLLLIYSINQITIYVIFRKRILAEGGLTGEEVDWQWEDSDLRTSGWVAATWIDWPTPDRPMMRRKRNTKSPIAAIPIDSSCKNNTQLAISSGHFGIIILRTRTRRWHGMNDWKWNFSASGLIGQILRG